MPSVRASGVAAPVPSKWVLRVAARALKIQPEHAADLRRG
jgi:hypothetical protein